MASAQTLPTPDGLPKSTPRVTTRLAGMLSPSERGDHIARRWAIRGIVAYLVLTTTFIGTSLAAETRQHRTLAQGIGQLLGINAESINYTTLLLVISGVALTVASMWTVFADIRRMTIEEVDVDWVIDHGRPGLLYVFLPASSRKKRFDEDEEKRRSGISVDPPGPHSEGARVESIIDDRVRRVQRAAQTKDSLTLSPEEFRILAEKRTATLGGLARYFGALLLLLAVVGTFAGVKTALPDLIRVFEDTSGAAASSPGAIGAPLRLVADAFGGNALALIGAIALGIMAQGLAFGRQSFLERLELASVEYIYRVSDTDSGSPLEMAMRNLEKAATGLRGSNDALNNIALGLSTLGEEFRTQFGSLDRRLTELATRHESNLYNENAKALNALNDKLAQIADAVSANAGVYAGLVNRIDVHAQAAQMSVEALGTTNSRLTEAISVSTNLNTHGRVVLGEISTQADRVDRGAQSVERQLTDLNSGLVGYLNQVRTETTEQISALVGVVSDAQPTLRQLDTSLEALSERISASHQDAAKLWADASKNATTSFEGAVESLKQTVGRVETRVSTIPTNRVSGQGLDPNIANSLVRMIEQNAMRDRITLVVLGTIAVAVIVDVVMWFR